MTGNLAACAVRVLGRGSDSGHLTIVTVLVERAVTAVAVFVQRAVHSKAIFDWAACWDVVVVIVVQSLIVFSKEIVLIHRDRIVY